jgi:hypothetical protein
MADATSAPEADPPLVFVRRCSRFLFALEGRCSKSSSPGFGVVARGAVVEPAATAGGITMTLDVEGTTGSAPVAVAVAGVFGPESVPAP